MNRKWWLSAASVLCGLACLADVVVDEETVSLDLSLNYRLRGESWDNGFGARLNNRTGDEDLIYSRLYLGGVLHYEAWLDLGVELRDSRVHNGPDAFYADGDRVNGFNDDDPTDLSQLYLTIRVPGDFPMEVTGGRQYWQIGDQRLVGPLKWTNNARGFDGVKVTTALAELPLTFYYGRHINQFNQEKVNDAWDSAYDYLGGVTTPNRYLGADDGVLYVLYSDRKASTLRDTVTAGALSKWNPEGPLSFSNETALQVGDAHQAYAVSARATFTPSDCPADPSISLELNYGSGDSDPTDDSSRTFDNLYPTNHAHYGMMDYGSWRNSMSAGLLTKVTPMERWTSEVNIWALGLAESEDNWYAASGAPVGAAGGRDNGSQHLGTEVDLVNTVTLHEKLVVQLGLGYFFAGNAVEGRSGGEDAAFGYLQATLTY